MNIKQYLQRIQYTSSLDNTFNTLSNLQLSHLLTVPFENLDIHNGIRIDLKDLFNKIIIRRRGGFCYELNGLFYELLQQLGFNVKMISARVYDGKNDYSPEYDHMALIVKIHQENYLTDVGFGEFAFYPINIQFKGEIEDPRGIFKIENVDGIYKVQKKNAGGEFIPEYIFTTKERHVEEFYERCNYHQTNAASHFMQKRICSLPTKNGRITLTGNTLKITENGVTNERIIGSEDEVVKELLVNFGIKL